MASSYMNNNLRQKSKSRLVSRLAIEIPETGIPKKIGNRKIGHLSKKDKSNTVIEKWISQILYGNEERMEACIK